MKKKDLSPGLEVAVKDWGNRYSHGVVVDTTGWSDRFYSSRTDPAKKVRLEDGKVYDVKHFQHTGTKVLVLMNERTYAGAVEPRLKAVALQNILGPYAEVKALRDENDRVRQVQREQAMERERRVEARHNEVRNRLDQWLSQHEVHRGEVYATLRVPADVVEALLDAAGE